MHQNNIFTSVHNTSVVLAICVTDTFYCKILMLLLVSEQEVYLNNMTTFFAYFLGERGNFNMLCGVF
jgi:hypothetical protein